jgi:prephenate dehydrogenase
MGIGNLSIIGLGLIGGSIAISAGEARLAGSTTAFDTDPGSLDQALSSGCIDVAAGSLEEAVAEADLIILAVPVLSVAPVAFKVREMARPGAVISDVGSTKGSIVSAMEASGPPEVFFVGGHPIAGTENSGFPAARGDLFRGSPFIVTATNKTDQAAADLVAGFWSGLGSRIHRMTPDEHDRLFALISHLPHVVAYALVGTVMGSLDHDQVEAFTGGGFRDYTRIAASDPVMWRDICLDNRTHILKTLDHLINELSFIRETMAEGEGEVLQRLFEKARVLKRSL